MSELLAWFVYGASSYHWMTLSNQNEFDETNREAGVSPQDQIFVNGTRRNLRTCSVGSEDGTNHLRHSDKEIVVSFVSCRLFLGIAQACAASGVRRNNIKKTLDDLSIFWRKPAIHFSWSTDEAVRRVDWTLWVSTNVCSSVVRATRLDAGILIPVVAGELGFKLVGVDIGSGRIHG